MPQRNLIVVAVAMAAVVLAQQVIAFQNQQQAETVRRVKRIRRPVFDAEKATTPFFGDLYAEGTVGPRPDIDPQQNSGSFANGNGQSTGGKSAGTPGGPESDPWSQIIDAAVIEDEVKSLQQQLNALVTTPVVFQTKFNEVNHRFWMLSMLFAIIRQYDGQVRWDQHAPTAQVLFQQAAVASRTGTLKGFQYCKSRKEDLELLVRGGSIAADDNVDPNVDWETAADRSPIMVQLEMANDALKRMTSNASEFQANAERIFHHSNLVAAMAKVILQSGMPESEEESYAEFSIAMQTAALQLKSSVKNNDFAAALSAANAVSQSCADCHAQWR